MTFEEKKQLAREFRAMINANVLATKKLIRIDELTEDEVSQMIDLYPRWEDLIGTWIEKNEYIQYNNKLYKIIKGLTLLENWRPDETPSDFTPMFPDNIIPLWVQPTHSENAYNIGDQVIYNDVVWESKIVGNDTVPDSDEPYNRFWKKV